MPAPAETLLKRALTADDHAEVVRLYTAAADQAELSNNIDEASFFLTQGWILALQHDLADSQTLQQRLYQLGRL
jgi:predicted ATPase